MTRHDDFPPSRYLSGKKIDPSRRSTILEPCPVLSCTILYYTLPIYVPQWSTCTLYHGPTTASYPRILHATRPKVFRSFHNLEELRTVLRTLSISSIQVGEGEGDGELSRAPDYLLGRVSFTVLQAPIMNSQPESANVFFLRSRSFQHALGTIPSNRQLKQIKVRNKRRIIRVPIFITLFHQIQAIYIFWYLIPVAHIARSQTHNDTETISMAPAVRMTCFVSKRNYCFFFFAKCAGIAVSNSGGGDGLFLIWLFFCLGMLLVYFWC